MPLPTPHHRLLTCATRLTHTLQLRLLEAAKLRYDAAIVPAASRVSLTPAELGGMRLVPVRSLGQALAEVFGQGVLPPGARAGQAAGRRASSGSGGGANAPPAVGKWRGG